MAQLVFKDNDAYIEVNVNNDLVTNDVREFVNEAFDAIRLYAKKNHDYGNSFNKGMEVIGNAYGVGRIFDKVNRLVSLCNKEGKAQIDESCNDTLMDLACYSLMTLAYRKKAKINKVNNIKFD